MNETRTIHFKVIDKLIFSEFFYRITNFIKYFGSRSRMRFSTESISPKTEILYSEFREVGYFS